MTEPPLRWVGGKGQIVDDLKKRFPVNYDAYHEPFMGGGAVFFKLGLTGGSINDLNTRLMSYYRQVRNNPEALIDKLQSFRDPLSDKDEFLEYSGLRRTGRAPSDLSKKVYYYQQRDLFNRRVWGEEYDELNEAARFQYLNRTNLNGLYRENNDGEFSPSVDTNGTDSWVFPDRVRAASKLLDNTIIYNRDFDYVVNEASANDLVYLDPPYTPLSASEDFTNYNSEEFGQEQQEKLLDVITDLTNMGVNVVVSNSGVMADRYERAGLRVEIIGVRRNINSDATNRDEVDEVIATNVPVEQ